MTATIRTLHTTKYSQANPGAPTGSVHAKGVIHLACDEGCLRHLINRKRMFQQPGKKCKYIYRMIRKANRQLSIHTVQKIMEKAVLYDVDCIVFEHLDRNGKKQNGKLKERIHMWRSIDVQERVELQAHRIGMRLSRVCAWNTSKLAYDGSGKVIRGKDAGLPAYSMCRFVNGKIYNCDLSAEQNIGARYYLRAYKKAGIKDLPAQPQCTLYTLRTWISSFKEAA